MEPHIVYITYKKHKISQIIGINNNNQRTLNAFWETKIILEKHQNSIWKFQKIFGKEYSFFVLFGACHPLNICCDIWIVIHVEDWWIASKCYKFNTYRTSSVQYLFEINDIFERNTLKIVTIYYLFNILSSSFIMSKMSKESREKVFIMIKWLIKIIRAMLITIVIHLMNLWKC